MWPADEQDETKITMEALPPLIFVSFVTFCSKRRPSWHSGRLVSYSRRLMFKDARLQVLVLPIALLAILGCNRGGEGLAIVKGKITYKGKPVPNGTVNFLPDDGHQPSATGEIQPDGSYALQTFLSNRPSDGAVIGKHKVVIVAMEDMAARLPEERIPLPPPIVPIKYTSPATSDLTAEVKDKDNTINFDLDDPPK
jgi:hypothetical protein